MLSIDACLTYTARLDSAREHIRKSERGKKMKAPEAKQKGEITTSAPPENGSGVVNNAPSVGDTSKVDSQSSDGSSAYDLESDSQGGSESGCSEDDASR